ncbi:DUF4405 domain-containing protein [candidate division KSB1 bacterium]|nr:DUF4405 domain-containing protein [candidate division KSB1 bacterium]
MNKQKALKVVNVLLALMVIGILTSAVSHDFIDKAIFEKVHPLGGFTLIILIIIHLSLNWLWVKSTYFKTKK